MALRDSLTKIWSGVFGRVTKTEAPVQLVEADLKQQAALENRTPLMQAAQADGGTFDMLLARSNDEEIHLTASNGLNATMIAIRHSALDNASALMKRGGVVDFADPLVNIQITVASYEAKFDFLKTLEERRQMQEDDATKLAARRIADEQRAAAEQHTNKVAEIVSVVAAGADSVSAPATARFRLKSVPKA